MSKLARTVITFLALLIGYLGYTRLFAVVAESIQPDFRTPLDGPSLSPSLSRSAREATDLALRVFGKDHWATHSDKRYYNVERGYWMYWDQFERPEANGGKRIEFSPFAVIWRSKNDESVKVLSGDRAIVDFDQPFDLLRPGPKPKLVYARVEGTKDYVFIQDDKGTSEPSDDMIVTMPYAEYFESDMQIRCDQEVHLTERDVTVHGTGMVIDLRAPEGRQGFPGAEMITLKRQVVFKAEDVGRTGLMPGTARPDQQVAANGAGPAKTPVLISSDGEMTLRLPRPSLPALVGPPAPAPPTVVKWTRNVLVRRGIGLPDQINGDSLTAILIPRERSTSVESQKTNSSEEPREALGGLTLLEARVQGHAVWLQSEAERLKVRGNELIYRKPGPDLPEESYFQADPGKQLYMERVEVDEKNELQSLTIVYASDATLRGDPKGQGGSSVVARGPGWLEQRSGPNQPVERWAKWRNELILDISSRPDPSSGVVDGNARRTYITLKGDPMVDDPAQVSMASRDEMVVCLRESPQEQDRAKASLASTSSTGPDQNSPRRAYRIEWITAQGDVHMITPETTPQGTPTREGRRMLNARDQLQVVFEHAERSPTTEATTGPARSPVRSASIVSINSEEPAPTDQAMASETPGTIDPATASEGQGLEVEADMVWARVVMDRGEGLNLSSSRERGGATASRDVREIRLRGGVHLRQDPAEGQDQGLELSAAAVDVINGGAGRLRLYAHGQERELARLINSEMTLEGPMLGAEQARHYAWVQGPGTLTMQSAGESLDGMVVKTDGSTSPTSPLDAPNPKTKKPMVIRWQERMMFHGIYPDEQGRPGPARALFLSKVDARMADDRVAAEELEAIFDRQVSFDRSPPGAKSEADVPGQRPQIESIICRQNVRVGSWMRDEAGLVREVREVHGQVVRFERPTGYFWVDEAGTVLITGNSKPAESDESEEGEQAAPGGERASADPKLYQTRLDFRKGMEGQIGMDDAGKPSGYREATFKGDVQVLRAVVPDYRTRLLHDRPPAEYLAMESDRLDLEQNPAVPAARQPERSLMKAYGSSTARTAKEVIQGDTIVYDSLTGLVYVRGTNAPVVIQNQDTVGQQFSQANARAVVYNPRTRQSRLLEPGSMRIFDPGGAPRIGPEDPRKEKPKERPKRPEPRLPSRSSIERRGFGGGQ